VAAPPQPLLHRGSVEGLGPGRGGWEGGFGSLETLGPCEGLGLGPLLEPEGVLA
jgi:hypothetical protein